MRLWFARTDAAGDSARAARPRSSWFEPEMPWPVANHFAGLQCLAIVMPVAGTTAGEGTPMKWIHIIAGLLALASGAVALYAAKGSTLHRKSGLAFVVAMWVMTSSAVLIAAFLRPNPVNVVAGILTFYLVSTGLLTVRKPVEQMRRVATGLMLAALVASVYAYALAFEAMNSPTGTVGHVPPQPLFMFGVVGTLAVLGDARLLWAGSIQGAARLARHLWRMSFAMWIATASFFLGQAKLFPAPIRQSGLLALPVLLVLGLLAYWLVRMLLKRRSAAIVDARGLRFER